MDKDFLAFAQQQGCQLMRTGKGHTTRIHFNGQNLGYVNGTVHRRKACYGYRFWWEHSDDAAANDSEVLFKERYGDLSGLDWHHGTGANSHRQFLCIGERKSAEAVLLKDIELLRNR